MKIKNYKYRKASQAKKKSAFSVPDAMENNNPEAIVVDKECEPVASSSLAVPFSSQNVSSFSPKVIFWRPRYLADSQWLQHVPFYFWLTEVLRPNVVVEPNLNSAVGYFAICQAIDKLNHDGLAYGAYGSQCNIEQVSRYNHEHYREFSHLVASDELAFISDFDDASIDLLMLKPGTPLLVNESGQAGLSPLLQSKLSAHAVVLIHGSMLSDHRLLCASLRSNYPSFELTQHNGLLLLCMGKQIPAQLETLINQGQDARAQRLIQNIYARLGSANEDAWQCRVYERQVHELTQQLQAQTHHIQQIKGAKQAFSDKLQQASQDVAAAKAHQAELAAKLAALGDETAEKRKQKQRLLQEKAQLEQELTVLKRSRQQAAANMASLQQDIDVRFDELAKLTQLLVDAEAKLDTLQHDNQALREQLSETQGELEKTKIATQQDLAKLQAELAKTQGELTQAKAQASQANNEKTQAQAELSQTQNKLGQAQSNLSQAQNELNQARTELASTAAQLQQLLELTALLERDQEVAADKISTLAQAELALQQSLNERFEELATLTNLLQQQEQQVEASAHELKAAQQRLSALQPQSSPQTAAGFTLKNTFKAAKQRRAKARQLALDVALIRQSELFDEAWYLKQHPEAANHKHGAAGHYLENGVALAANPSATFDGNWYLSTHQDVKDAGMNPLFHYMKFGQKESRLLKII